MSFVYHFINFILDIGNGEKPDEKAPCKFDSRVVDGNDRCCLKRAEGEVDAARGDMSVAPRHGAN